MIPVLWLGAHPLCWDQAMLDDALSGRMWPTGYQFRHLVLDDIARPDTVNEGAIVIVPGAAYATRIDQVNELLAGLRWALVCVTSDEERRFPIEKLNHPNMALWLQYPRQNDAADTYLPVGYPPHFRALLPTTTVRPVDWTFAGQVNHARRREAVAALRELAGIGRLEVSEGFTQGLAYREYAESIAESHAVICPSGPKSIDSFRVAEAMEAGAVPIVDGRTPTADDSWLWGLVYGTPVPFPVVHQWADIADVVQALPSSASISSWWHGWKRRWCERIGNTIAQLSNTAPTPEPLTVLVPTSPIAAHPDTGIIEETLRSIRYHQPHAEILIMCDGVRPEQGHYRANYAEYLDRLTWHCGRDGRAWCLIHDRHTHQAEMTRRALAWVTTPLVLYVEHDTPLVTDEPIDWDAVTAATLSGDVDLIRFHYEARIHPEHEHLMLDQEPTDVHGAPLLRTVQWSQRPHLATTGFYRRILQEDFPSNYVGMIEDRMHGLVHSAWRTYGPAGWDRYRLATYAPPGGNIKRSLHLDGRGIDEKWVDR